MHVKYLHTMVRVTDLEASMAFYALLGLKEIKHYTVEEARFTLVYLNAPADAEQVKKQQAPLLELTYNWDTEVYTGGRNFGHLAFEVDNIYSSCQTLLSQGITINRPPRDGYMAFIRSPDGISIELLQKGEPLPPAEPWVSMQNTGSW